MKTGIVVGAFDLLHAGHIHLLRQCAEECDYLIVGLQVDPSVDRSDKNKPIETVLERQIKLLGCKYVDKVVVYGSDWELENIFKYFDPDIRFLGSDYGLNLKPIRFEYMVPIEFMDSLDIHTSHIRDRVIANQPKKTK